MGQIGRSRSADATRSKHAPVGRPPIGENGRFAHPFARRSRVRGGQPRLIVESDAELTYLLMCGAIGGASGSATSGWRRDRRPACRRPRPSRARRRSRRRCGDDVLTVATRSSANVSGGRPSRERAVEVSGENSSVSAELKTGSGGFSSASNANPPDPYLMAPVRDAAKACATISSATSTPTPR